MSSPFERPRHFVERALVPDANDVPGQFWQHLALALFAVGIICALGPLWGSAVVFAIPVAVVLMLGPSRLMLLLFIAFMVTSQEYRSLFTVGFGGVVWHPREMLLLLLAGHGIAKVLQLRVRILPAPMHLFYLMYGSFFIYTAFTGILSEPNTQRIVAEVRYPIFLLSYIPLVMLVNGRKDVRFFAKWILGLTLFIALLSLLFFAFTALAGWTVNVQNGWGAFVPRQLGSRIVQSVRPRGHMFYEICITVLVSFMLHHGATRRKRLVYGLMCGLLVAAMLIMFMRTALVALVVSLLLLGFLCIPSRRLQVRLLWAGGAALGAVLVVVTSELLAAGIHQWIDRVGPSLAGRFIEVQGAWRQFTAHPLMGAGMGSTFQALGLTAKSSGVAYAQVDYQTIHNVWMYFLFKGGLVGLTLVLVGLSGLFWRGWHVMNESTDVWQRLFLRGLIAAFAGQWVASLAMPRMTYPVGYTFVALYTCAVVVLAHATRADKARSALVDAEAAPPLDPASKE